MSLLLRRRLKGHTQRERERESKGGGGGGGVSGIHVCIYSVHIYMGVVRKPLFTICINENQV